MYWDAPAQTVWLKRVFNRLFPRRILCQLIMRYEKRALNLGVHPPSIDFFFVVWNAHTLSQLSKAAGSTYKFFSGNCNANEVLQRQISQSQTVAVSSCLSHGKSSDVSEKVPRWLMRNGQNIRKICMENVYISAMKEWRSLHLTQHLSPLKMRSKLRLA